MARMVLVALAVFALALAASAQQAGTWNAAWTSAAFIALLISYLAVGVAFMYAIGFQDSKLEAWCKQEFYQVTATAVMLGILLGMDAMLNEVVYPAFWSQSILNPGSSVSRSTPGFCGYQGIDFLGISLNLKSITGYTGVNYFGGQVGGEGGASSSFRGLQDHAVAYASCIRGRMTWYYLQMSAVSSLLGFISSIWFSINPEGFVGAYTLTPGLLLKPGVDMINYVMSGMTLMIMQMRAQEMILGWARDFMFAFILPLGVALRSFAATRGAGGALIALAVGFYMVFPITYLFQEEMVVDWCNAHDCKMDMLAALVMDQPVSQMLAAMFESGQRGSWNGAVKGWTEENLCPEAAAGQSCVSENAPRYGDVSNLFSLNGPLGPLVFLYAIAGVVFPVFSLIITLMFIRSLAGVLGSDVDFSSLVKII